MRRPILPGRSLRRARVQLKSGLWSSGQQRPQPKTPTSSVIEIVGSACGTLGDCVTLATMCDASVTLEQVFREEYGRIIATLIRISGSFDLAEEALQEAFTSAALHWKADAP